MKYYLKNIIILLLFFLSINTVYAEEVLNTSSIDITYNLNGGTILPEGYTLLEYIKSNGTQYIDTGISIYSNTKIISNFSAEPVEITPENESYTLEKDFNLFGSYGSWKGLAFAVRLDKFRFWASSQKMTEQKYIEGAEYKVILNDNGNFSINDQILYTNSKVNQLEETILVFTAKHNTSLTGLKNGFMKLYDLSIYQGTELVSYLLPVKDSNNVIGLYDVVRNTFLTNLGTNEFIAGPELTTYSRKLVLSTKLEYLPTPTKTYNTFLGWYQDSNLTIPITQETIISNDISNIYAAWQEHPHIYNHTGIVDNQIGNICECGQIDPNSIISIDIPKEITYDGTTKEVSLINTLNLNENEYEIIYKQKDIDGKYKEINTLPKHTGDYIVVLKYDNQEITKEFKIVREITNPNTSSTILPFLIILFLIAPSILIAINYNKYKNKIYIV